jgi:hypothetical protein
MLNTLIPTRVIPRGSCRAARYSRTIIAQGILASLLAGWASAARGAVVLVVDVSNPAAVTFTATGAFADINYNLPNAQFGVSLADFFTQPIPTNDTEVGTLPHHDLASGNLTPTGGGTPYYQWNGSDVGIRTKELWFDVFADIPVYSTSAPAFTGSATIDLSSIAYVFEAGETFHTNHLTTPYLPSVGSTGNVVVGPQASGYPAIGSYLVVPEPSLAAWPAASVLSLGAWAVKRRNSRSR